MTVVGFPEKKPADKPAMPGDGLPPIKIALECGIYSFIGFMSLDEAEQEFYEFVAMIKRTRGRL